MTRLPTAPHPPSPPSRPRFLLLLLPLFPLPFTLYPFPLSAQITPDGTVGTTVIGAPNFTIDGGTRPSNGPNLFHSFSQFSVPTGGSAVFNNAPDVVNIINRVTGGNLSNIDGLIQANGTANLFLINPAGIIFGPNASLNIGGSFIGSTANSLKFSDGTEFSAINLTPPLLSINVPIGLQMGPNPGAIANQSQMNGVGLQVTTGQTLALIGGAISLPGGYLSAPDGRIALGSVDANSTVGIAPDPSGWAFDYQGVPHFQDIQLTQAALVDTTGNSGGSIQVQGRRVGVSEAASIRSGTTGTGQGGNLQVSASEVISLQAGIIGTDVFDTASGHGGNVQITAPRVVLNDLSVIYAETLGTGTGGNLTIDSHTVELFGNSDGDGAPSVLSTTARGPGQGGTLTINAQRFYAQDWAVIVADSYGSGHAGNLIMNVQQLTLVDGVQMGSGTFGAGNGGNIIIQATESIQVSGFKTWAEGFFSTGIFASAETDSTGNAGNVFIHTNRLSLTQGGKVATNLVGSGNAGNIVIQAQEIEVADPVVDFTGAISGIVVSVVEGARGNGGNLTIQADQVRVLNGGQITASTDGEGNAGSINIESRVIDLSGLSSDGQYRSSISAKSSTVFSAGSIMLTSDLLNVRAGAEITVSNSSTGNAGTLTINTNNLGLDNGKISTSTLDGQGGRISLNTNQLHLSNNSLIDSSTAGKGNAGAIALSTQNIQLDNSTISTQSEGSGSAGTINLVSQTLDLDNQATFSSAASNRGSAGSLNLKAQRTTLLNGSQITTRSTGTGDGGTVSLSGNSLTLRNGSSINATTTSGNGGNLNFNLLGLLYLRDLSQLTAEAGGTGNGGNININALFVVGWGNSDIIADAFKGNGGNIQITTQGIFGLKFRPQLTPDNDITASSQFGLNGSVQINRLGFDPSSGLVKLPDGLVDSSRQIVDLCSSTEGSSFVITGRGGLPSNPLERMEKTMFWEDLRDLSEFEDQAPVKALPRQSEIPMVIVEANAIRRNPDGTVELVATGAESLPASTNPNCVNPARKGASQ